MGNTELFKSSDALDISNDSVYMRISSSIVSKVSFLYLQGLGHFKMQKDYYVDRRNYNSFQAMFTLSGKGILIYNGQKYILSPGDCAVINCKNHHYYKPLTDNVWETKWVHFNGANSLEYYNLFTKNNDSPVVALSDMKKFTDIIDKLIETNRHQDIFTELNNSRYLVEIFTDLILNSKHKLFIDALDFAPVYIKEIISHIDMHFIENITLDKLSEMYSISKFHLSREFKRYTGTTIKEHIISIRISRAKEILKTTSLPISTVSSMVGIENTTHFINQFKEREGYTPLAFRKNFE